jgi:CspA family cold shock protein
MFNHGRNRQPRRRDFDDFGYDRPPMGGGSEPRFQSRPSAPTAFGPEVEATVKWFNPDKGFGFVQLADGSGDVFLHANALSSAGYSTVSPGATLRVRIGQGQKGRQVAEVSSVDESTATQNPGPGSRSRPPGGPRQPRDQGPAVQMRGTVKWYNPAKGFGFVSVAEGGQDVFLHASALQRGGLTQVSEGQAVWVDVVQGPRDRRRPRFDSSERARPPRTVSLSADCR